MTAGLLERLPKTRGGGPAVRLAMAYGAAWIVAILGLVVGSQLAGESFWIVLLAVLLTMFAAGIAVIMTGIAWVTQSARAVAEAEALLARDSRAAFERASDALRLGAKGRFATRAWLVVERYAEDVAALDDADEALRRALDYKALGHHPLFVLANMRRAFTRAALGDLVGAEQHLRTYAPVDVANPSLHAAHTRAQAMILYKEGRFREVVDVAVTTGPGEAAFSHRDRALLEALRHSSLLRLEANVAASPTRVASEPAPDPWVDRILPELRAARG